MTVQSLNHCTTRKVPIEKFLKHAAHPVVSPFHPLWAAFLTQFSLPSPAHSPFLLSLLAFADILGQTVRLVYLLALQEAEEHSASWVSRKPPRTQSSGHESTSPQAQGRVRGLIGLYPGVTVLLFEDAFLTNW